MNQLVELNKNAESFSELGVQVIAVFREEAKGVEGLEKIRAKTKVDFVLALDTGKEQTGGFTSGKMKFHSYLIGRDGKVAAIVEGDLKNRAKSKELIARVEDLSKKGGNH